jgi:hypothetical protein
MMTKAQTTWKKIVADGNGVDDPCSPEKMIHEIPIMVVSKVNTNNLGL